MKRLLPVLLLAACRPAASDVSSANTAADSSSGSDSALETSTGLAMDDSTSSSGPGTTSLGSSSSTATTGGASSSTGETADEGWIVRGRFESAGPAACEGLANWDSPDGPLLRFNLDLCGDDLEALADTVRLNLDAVERRGQQALVVFNQGINLPSGWLENCETYSLNSGNFVGELCVPWDPNYQEALGTALRDVLGPAVNGHAALAAVYFTITTMTNGAEMHFRVQRSAFPYPGDEVFRGAYLDVMDSFQDAFAAPIVFEAGHCIWLGDIDCETPRALYEHSRDTHGLGWSGIALWNCAERFWAGDGNEEATQTKALIELATTDGASIGCQTVGSFTDGACRFSDPEVGDYGSNEGQVQDNCPPSRTFDPEGACVDTMRWFAGEKAQSAPTAAVVGTWAENWSVDYDSDGIATTSESCRAAIDLFAP